VCDGCAVSTDSNMTDTRTSPPTGTPTQATTGPIISVTRPEEDGGYPGVLFPWQSGDDCPQGYDYCGTLEFYTGENSLDTGPTYGYWLPCPAGETCECNGGPGPLIWLVPGNVYKMMLYNAGTEVCYSQSDGRQQLP